MVNAFDNIRLIQAIQVICFGSICASSNNDLEENNLLPIMYWLFFIDGFQCKILGICCI